jgi:hypothetical protein
VEDSAVSALKSDIDAESYLVIEAGRPAAPGNRISAEAAIGIFQSGDRPPHSSLSDL